MTTRLLHRTKLSKGCTTVFLDGHPIPIQGDPDLPFVLVTVPDDLPPKAEFVHKPNRKDKG